MLDGVGVCVCDDDTLHTQSPFVIFPSVLGLFSVPSVGVFFCHLYLYEDIRFHPFFLFFFSFASETFASVFTSFHFISLHT